MLRSPFGFLFFFFFFFFFFFCFFVRAAPSSNLNVTTNGDTLWGKVECSGRGRKKFFIFFYRVVTTNTYLE